VWLTNVKLWLQSFKLPAEFSDLLEGADFMDVRVAEQPLPTRFVVLADKPT
jgi:hypothetical protein